MKKFLVEWMDWNNNKKEYKTTAENFGEAEEKTKKYNATLIKVTSIRLL